MLDMDVLGRILELKEEFFVQTGIEPTELHIPLWELNELRAQEQVSGELLEIACLKVKVNNSTMYVR